MDVGVVGDERGDALEDDPQAGRRPVDGEPRDGGHCFEEAPDNVLALGEQRVAEPLQDEWGEVGAVHLGEGDVAVSSSVIGLLCSSCVPVLSRG